MIANEGTPFEVGKARLCREGKDVTVFANGAMVHEAICTAEALAGEGISVRVYDLHTVKPLDCDAVVSATKETGCIVTAKNTNSMAAWAARSRNASRRLFLCLWKWSQYRTVSASPVSRRNSWINMASIKKRFKIRSGKS